MKSGSGQVPALKGRNISAPDKMSGQAQGNALGQRSHQFIAS